MADANVGDAGEAPATMAPLEVGSSLPDSAAGALEVQGRALFRAVGCVGMFLGGAFHDCKLQYVTGTQN